MISSILIRGSMWYIIQTSWQHSWGLIEQYKVENRKDVMLMCIYVYEGKGIKDQDKIIKDRRFCEKGISL